MKFIKICLLMCLCFFLAACEESAKKVDEPTKKVEGATAGIGMQSVLPCMKTQTCTMADMQTPNGYKP